MLHSYRGIDISIQTFLLKQQFSPRGNRSSNQLRPGNQAKLTTKQSKPTLAARKREMVLHGITVSASTPPLKPRLTRCGASWAQTNLRTRKSKLPRRSRTCPVIVALQIHGHHRQGYQSQRHLAYAIDLDVALQVPAACPAACIHCPSNRALDRDFPPHWVLSIC